mgnify:CR=1 FL=1
MTNIFYSPEFRKEIKRLAKKYRSIPEDLIELRTRLLDNPFEGVDLGMGVRKVRMSIKSKGKGKSGGARVITYSLIVDDKDINLTLLTIYDKSERSTISDKEIKDLLAYLKTIDNGKDDLAVRRIINVPKRAIGETTLKHLQEYADQQDISLFAAILDVDNISTIKSGASKYKISFI